MSIYIEEFLYRGKPDGTGAYHVIVAESTTGNIVDVCTPTFAELKYSLTLPKIFDKIVKDALKAKDNSDEEARLAKKALRDLEDSTQVKIAQIEQANMPIKKTLLSTLTFGAFT